MRCCAQLQYCVLSRLDLAVVQIPHQEGGRAAVGGGEWNCEDVVARKRAAGVRAAVAAAAAAAAAALQLLTWVLGFILQPAQ